MSRAGVNVRQFRHSILLLAIVSFGLLPVAHTAGAGCVSYGDFLHPLGAYHPPGSYLRSIAYQEPHLYAMDDAGLLSVADASDPAFLHLLGSLDLAAESRGMAVAGSIAYAGLAPRSLQLVDLSDAGAPKPLGCAQIPSLIWNVEVAGSYAYVVAWEYGHDDHGVYVVDVSDPLAPVVGARVDVGSYPRDIAVAGGYGYVIEQYGLCVLDLANPAQPTVVSALDIPGDTRYLAVRDGFVYVVRYENSCFFF